MQNWLAVASANHVAIGREQGFAQVNHGKSAPLRRMQPDDLIAYYSQTEVYGQRKLLQSFTALGRIAQGEPNLPDDRRFHPLPARCGLAAEPPGPYRPLAAPAGTHRRQDQLGLPIPLWPVQDRACRYGPDCAGHGLRSCAAEPACDMNLSRKAKLASTDRAIAG